MPASPSAPGRLQTTGAVPQAALGRKPLPQEEVEQLGGALLLLAAGLGTHNQEFLPGKAEKNHACAKVDTMGIPGDNYVAARQIEAVQGAQKILFP